MTDAERQARISELEKLIREAKDAYYNKTPVVADDVYDAWEDELAELDAVNSILGSVGAPVVSEWKKVKHKVSLGSLGKVNTPEEMDDWVSTYASGETLLTTEKLDGISVHVEYQNGKLSLAATRGDGSVGEDITVNVAKMKGVPSTLPRKLTLSVRGEIVLLKSDLQSHFSDYANTRNAASGISKRYDGRGCEHLTVFFYKITSGADLTTEAEQFKFMSDLGLNVPWWTTTQAPNDAWLEYQQTKRDALDYDIDGLVVSINDLAKQFALGEKDLRPIGSTAFKFAAIMRETTVKSITWQTGGTGRITPVAQFDAVSLLGASVTNASVYNYAYIKQLGIDVGAKVLVARANDVIPRVVKVTNSVGSVASAPDTCASCGSATAWDGEYLVCSDKIRCPAQVVGRLSHWIKSLEILEWGDTLLDKLVSAGFALSVSDLYTLTEDKLGELDRMGPKLAAKLIANLHEKKTLPLETLLGSLSIPGVATSTIKSVIDAGFDDIAKIRTASLADLSRVSGLGPVKAGNLHRWFAENGSVVDDLLAVGVTAQERVRGKFTALTFCFTGEMKHKRGDLENMVKNFGGEVKNSVTKKLSYLVLADTTTTKAAQAKKYGVKCLSEDEFLAMVNA